MDREVNILGAGISGLACAIILSRNGYEVNVYEKHASIGIRFNNDWQGLENWSEDTDVLEQMGSYGIDMSFDHEPLCEIDIHYSGKVRTIRGDNACYLVRRGNSEGCLDTALFEQARELGVSIHFGHNPDNNVPIHVNATGPKYAALLARGITFTTEHEDSYHMAFGPDIARGFYSYLLIKDGHGTIATVFDREIAHRSEEFLENTVDCFSGYVDRKELDAGHRFGGYGNFEINDSFHDEDGSMLVGEAGGFQDNLWGFGMRYAFQSAYFASRAIMFGESYDKLIKENLIRKMKHSKRNRTFFEFMGALSYPAAYYLLAVSRDPLRLLNAVYR